MFLHLKILNNNGWNSALIFTRQIYHVNEPQASLRRRVERSSSLGSKCKFVIFMCIYKWLCLAVKTAATSWNRSTNCQLGVWVMSGGSLYRVLVQNQNLKPRWSCNFFFRLTNGSHHKSYIQQKIRLLPSLFSTSFLILGFSRGLALDSA